MILFQKTIPLSKPNQKSHKPVSCILKHNLYTALGICFFTSSCTSVPNTTGPSLSPVENYLSTPNATQKLSCPFEKRLDTEGVLKTMPVTNQGIIGDCYAQVLAKALGQKLGVLVSPTDIGVSIDRPTDALPLKLTEDKSTSYRDIWFTGSSTCGAFEAVKKRGNICKLDDVWIDNLKHPDGTFMSDGDSAQLLQELNHFYQDYERLNPAEKQTLLNEFGNEQARSACMDQQISNMKSAVQNFGPNILSSIEMYKNDPDKKNFDLQTQYTELLKNFGTLVPDDAYIDPIDAAANPKLLILPSYTQWLNNDYTQAINLIPKPDFAPIKAKLTQLMGTSALALQLINEADLDSLFESDYAYTHSPRSFQKCLLNQYSISLKYSTAAAPCPDCPVSPNLLPARTHLGSITGQIPSTLVDDIAKISKFILNSDVKSTVRALVSNDCQKKSLAIPRDLKCNAILSIENYKTFRTKSTFVADYPHIADKISEAINGGNLVMMGVYPSAFVSNPSAYKPDPITKRPTGHGLAVIGIRKRKETGCKLELLISNSWGASSSYVRTDFKKDLDSLGNDTYKFWADYELLTQKNELIDISYLSK